VTSGSAHAESPTHRDPPGNVDLLPWEPGASLAGWTVPAILRERARLQPERPALREKKLGVYRETTWSQLRDRVEHVALGLMSLGLEPGGRVAIMGDACGEYFVAEHAVWMAGGVSVGIYPTSAPAEVLYQVQNSGASIFIAEDQEHLDKLLAVRDEIEGLEAIVVLDMRTLFAYDHTSLLSFDALAERGRDSADGGALADRVAAIRPDEPVCIMYTSGTSGPPKGVVHTHETLLHGAESYILATPELRTKEQRLVAHMPLAHAVGKGMILVLPLLSRVLCHIPEHVERFAETTLEVAPTYALQPPRFYEKFAAQLLVTLETSSRLKRGTYHLAMKIARRVVKRRWENRRVPPHLQIASFLAQKIVFVPLLRQIGYHRLRLPYAGSASMPPEVAAVWQAWGLDLRIAYGLTECCGISVVQMSPFSDPRSIGVTPGGGWEAELAEDGELVVRGPGNFVGYWNMGDDTSAALVDGWLQTGDVAEMDADGVIRLIDRKKDIVITSGGKSLSPQQIENELKASPYVSEAIVIAERRKYVTALLELDDLTVQEWARNTSLLYGSFAELVARPEVEALIGEHVELANSRLSRAEQVKSFRILPIELDPERGEVTPTRKVKRAVIERMFSEAIESMYQGEEVGAIHSHVASIVER
jgi:long-chain acyl-CoA synthetase